jgi:hypothetical protein
MLIDRVCAGGGWNYGGSNVFGQDLLPYVPTTAWGVLALQDRPQEPALVQSLARLPQDATTEPTAQALALAVLALRVAGRPEAALTTALAREGARAMTVQHNVGLALTLYVLEDRTRGRAFTI